MSSTPQSCTPLFVIRLHCCGLPAPARRQFFALRFATVCHYTYLSLSAVPMHGVAFLRVEYVACSWALGSCLSGGSKKIGQNLSALAHEFIRNTIRFNALSHSLRRRRRRPPPRLDLASPGATCSECRGASRQARFRQPTLAALVTLCTLLDGSRIGHSRGRSSARACGTSAPCSESVWRCW